MGNSAGGLNFEVEEEIRCSNPVWSLHNGKRRKVSGEGIESFENVTVFRFTKADSIAKAECAQRGIQKLRTMKHPNILAFVDGSELDGSIVMATEAAIPLSVWIEEQQSVTDSDKKQLQQEIVWGFHCIVDALQFIHRTCKFVHGLIHPESIYITRTGDWKLAS